MGGKNFIQRVFVKCAFVAFTGHSDVTTGPAVAAGHGAGAERTGPVGVSHRSAGGHPAADHFDIHSRHRRLQTTACQGKFTVDRVRRLL